MVEVGALSNVNGDNSEGNMKTYNIYDVVQNPKPEGDFNYGNFSFQDYIGTSIMPTIQWVNYIKTGEIQYDPEDTQHQQNIKDYEAFIEASGQPEGLPTPGQIIANEVSPILGQVAEGVGTSLMTGGTFSEGLPFTKSGMDFAEGVTSFSPKALKSFDTTTMENLTKAGMSGGEIATEKAATVLGGEDKIGKFGGTVGRNELLKTVAERGTPSTFGERLTDAQQWKGAAGGAVGNFAVQLVMGRDPVKAAKSAGAGAIGKVIGNAILPGIGGWIG